MSLLDKLVERARGPVATCDELTESDIWSYHRSTVIWRANRFIGTPEFYPVYRYQNYYSYSVLSLILLKGYLRLNQRVAQAASVADFLYYSGRDTLDCEITRIGGRPSSRHRIKGPTEYIKRFNDAVRHDTAAVENAHPGYTNVILCGGKDSLNLLLLPWKNPVIAASAPPNFELVEAFLKTNSLDHDLIELRDDDDSLLELEVLTNCCRNNLEHYRWGPHLVEIARSLRGRVIFWIGQWGDILATPKWKEYSHPPTPLAGPPRWPSGCPAGAERVLRAVMERTGLTQRRF